jgi:hypothetical protein
LFRPHATYLLFFSVHDIICLVMRKVSRSRIYGRSPISAIHQRMILRCAFFTFYYWGAPTMSYPSHVAVSVHDGLHYPIKQHAFETLPIIISLPKSPSHIRFAEITSSTFRKRATLGTCHCLCRQSQIHRKCFPIYIKHSYLAYQEQPDSNPASPLISTSVITK